MKYIVYVRTCHFIKLLLSRRIKIINQSLYSKLHDN